MNSNDIQRSGVAGPQAGTDEASPGPLSAEGFVAEALRIIDVAQQQGVRLRLLGSIAYRLHCPQYMHLLDEMKRELTDLDFVGRSDERTAAKRMLVDMGYEVDQDLLVATDGQRFFFKHPTTDLGVDIFVDRLNFCHPIQLKDRLDLDYPTISLADLLMEKMQIVEINEKDIKDTLVLLLEHDLGPEREQIDEDYIASVLGNDWGFYYTMTTNLNKLGGFARRYGALTAEQMALIGSRVADLLKRIDDQPKSMMWKMRSKVGTKKKWYQEVSAKGSIL